MVSVTNDLGTASGVIVGEDGLILTALHAVQDAATITVGFNDGSEVQARLLGEDLGRDLALLKVPRSDLRAVPLADGASIRLGETVSKLGYPSGYLEVSTGIVSALVEPHRINNDRIQITADVNPGDSGAPIITAAGELAGIVVAKDYASEGVGFASPLTYNLVDRLAGGQRICQPTPPLLEGTTFSHRNGWSVDLPPGVEYDYSFAPEEHWYHSVARAEPFPWMQVQIQEMARSYRDLDEFFQYNPGWEGWEYTALTDSRLICHQAGTEAWEVDFEAADGEGYIYGERDIIIRRGQSWYLLLALAPYDGFMEVEQELDTVLYSFRFSR